jgi:hypothetical protein
MSPNLKCMFCDQDANVVMHSTVIPFECDRGGSYVLTQEALEDLPGLGIAEGKRRIISIELRNAFERRSRNHSSTV